MSHTKYPILMEITHVLCYSANNCATKNQPVCLKEVAHFPHYVISAALARSACVGCIQCTYLEKCHKLLYFGAAVLN